MSDTSRKPHSAIPSALGYLYQIYYALTLLHDSEQDEAFVSIETWDDVYFEKPGEKQLHQLKYTINPDAKIGIKSRDLWKTLKIWCDYFKANDTTNGEFVLATVADVDPSSPLISLSQKGSPRKKLVDALEKEATLVIEARSLAQKTGTHKKDLPYNDRYKGCLAFLGLQEEDRNELISMIIHRKGMWDISRCQDEIILILKHFPEDMREPLARRILGWWNTRAVNSMIDETASAIFASELKQVTLEIATQLLNDGFVDDISSIENPDDLILNGIMKDQLEIIDATNFQKTRSLRTEWRARYQRNKWIEDDPSTSHKIQQYNKHLVEEWQDQWHSIKDYLATTSPDDNTKKEKGRTLLDWSHNVAPQTVRPIRSTWTNSDLVRGTYQMLANELEVGWHPEFDEILKKIKNK